MPLGELSERHLYRSDSGKIDRNHRALASLITPESVDLDLDLGCGTGVLGLVATAEV